MPKFIRILTYEGSEQFINTALKNPAVPMNGSRNSHHGQITLVVVMAQSIPCITCGIPTDNEHSSVTNAPSTHDFSQLTNLQLITSYRRLYGYRDNSKHCPCHKESWA